MSYFPSKCIVHHNILYNSCTAHSFPSTSKETNSGEAAGVSESAKEKKSQKSGKSKSEEQNHHENDRPEKVKEKQENNSLAEVTKISRLSIAFKRTFPSWL